MQVVVVYLLWFRRSPLSKMCVAAWNREKFTENAYFWGSRSFEVIDVGTPRKIVSSVCYDKQQVCVYNLISLQTPCNTRSSSVVTLARPPTRSSLKITSRSFRYVSPYLWNQLPQSLRQPRLDLPLPDSSLLQDHLTSPVSSSPLLSSITSYASILNSKLSYFSNPTFHWHLAPLRTDFTDTRTALGLFSLFQFFF